MLTSSTGAASKFETWLKDVDSSGCKKVPGLCSAMHPLRLRELQHGFPVRLLPHAASEARFMNRRTQSRLRGMFVPILDQRKGGINMEHEATKLCFNARLDWCSGIDGPHPGIATQRASRASSR